ncbi:hypothetical protein (Partial), partial [Seminavis robusta]|eukprot:Sro4395_g353900.1 n/a (344) ;mRNA; f:825-1857
MDQFEPTEGASLAEGWDGQLVNDRVGPTEGVGLAAGSEQLVDDEVNRQEELETASMALTDMEARPSNTRQSGRLSFFPKEKQGKINGNLDKSDEKQVAADSKTSANHKQAIQSRRAPAEAVATGVVTANQLEKEGRTFEAIIATEKTVENEVVNIFVARKNAENNNNHRGFGQPGAYAMGGVPGPILTEENDRIEQEEEEQRESHIVNVPRDLTGSAIFSLLQTQLPEPLPATRLQRDRNVQTNQEPGAYPVRPRGNNQETSHMREVFNNPETSNMLEVGNMPSGAGDNSVQPFVVVQEEGLVEARAVDDEDLGQALTEARAVEPKSRNHDPVPYRPLGVGLLL